jgi:membrane fusion protein (multidrug efflux system)
MDPMPRRSRAGLKLAGVAALVAALAVAVNGIWHREQNERQLAQWTDAQAIPTVAIVRPQPETKAEPLERGADLCARSRLPEDVVY